MPVGVGEDARVAEELLAGRARDGRTGLGGLAKTASTSAGRATAYPSVKPPQPAGGAATPAVVRELARLQSETIMGPAWNITMSSSVNVRFQPSCS